MPPPVTSEAWWRHSARTRPDHQSPPVATDLGDLVAQARCAGLEVSAVATDTVIHDPSVSIATYRIVQEALANVARYAGPATCTVELARDDDVLEITVTDDGPRQGWRSHPGTGTGILGLHERARSVGGTLDAGPSGRGFVLHASLPDPAAVPS